MSKNIIALAKEVLQVESKSISDLQKYLNEGFSSTVHVILKSKGRVVITGIGKSAIIAQKIVATLNSTGTPSIFMHAADAVHGDLGIIQKDDVVICISNSGNTPEIKLLAPLLKKSGHKLIAMTGNMKSDLAIQADFCLNTTVEKEACPNNLAPTSSTTAQLAMGDALAVCLLKLRNFSERDFAKYHPGGALGKKMYLKVSDLFIKNEKPVVAPDDDVAKVIIEISSKRLGATAVINKGKLAGIITDGDVRRLLQKTLSLQNIKARDFMTINPKTVSKDTMAVDAFELMKAKNITQLVVADKSKFLGFVHLHDLLREGII